MQPDDPKILWLLEDMCKDVASPRLVRARSYVRVLAFGTWEIRLMFKNLALFLDLLPNLVELCLWKNYLPELFTYAHALGNTAPPKLRRIHTCSLSRESLPPQGFDYPLWKQITHLHLYSNHAICSEQSPFSQPLLNTMQNLTHLAVSSGACGDEVEAERDIELTISRATASFPTALQLCLLSLPPELISEQTFPRVDSLRLGEVPEIVLWSMPYYKAEFILDRNSHGPDAFSVWSGAQEGKLTFWEAGSEIQQQRKSVGQL